MVVLRLPGTRHARAFLFLLALTAAAVAGACDSDDDEGHLADAAPGTMIDAADACMGVGSSCTVDGECPDPFTCHGNSGQAAGVCYGARSDCGGIIGSRCADGQTCTYTTNGKLGLCVTPAELACICAHSPQTVAGC
jgi:hypothetical protein